MTVEEKIKEWNKGFSGRYPMSYDEYVCQFCYGYILANDEIGQDIVFKDPADAVKAIKHGFLYKVRDKYLYSDGENYISFSNIDDEKAPWNYMDWLV
jgi:hypothetical protein